MAAAEHDCSAGDDASFPVVVDSNDEETATHDSQAILLPKDILTCIFSRLPGKALWRFRCVCKSWHSLISDPFFINLHLDRAKKNTHLLLAAFDYELRHVKIRLCYYDEVHRSADLLFEKEFPRDPEDKGWPCDRENKGGLFMKHCNGLMLLSIGIQIHVGNPCTGEFITLPRGTNKFLGKYGDPCVGFGFDPFAKEYKVVRFFRRRLGVEVFTLGTHSWRLISNPPYPIKLENPALANGILFWMIPNTFHQSAPKVILSLNLSDEKFKVIPPPPCCSDLQRMAGETVLLEHEDNLYLSHMPVRDRFTISLWMLNDYTNYAWVQKYSMNLLRVSRQLKPVASLIKNGKVLFKTRDKLGYFDKLGYINPNTNTFEAIFDKGNYSHPLYKAIPNVGWDRAFQVTSYVETLVSVSTNVW